jgi:hypothetical protein
MDYENETCEGCVYFLGTMCGGGNTVEKPYSGASGTRTERADCWKGTDSCEHFAPSLECRKVRALEVIARRVVMQEAEELIGAVARYAGKRDE